MPAFAYHTISWCWIIFLVYWVINARKVKAVAEQQDAQASAAYRVITLIGFILMWADTLPEPFQRNVTPHNDVMFATGSVLCVAGLSVAIWARRTLAGNWSSNVTFKQGHELIKTGPYRFARHPIYTGLLLMVLGTALASSELHSWLGVVVVFIGLWIKLRGEEELMLRHFPDQYPAYRKEVKALVPFIL